MRVPDVEAALVALLSPIAPASTRVPSARPTRFIRVGVVGGVREDLIRSRPNLLIEAFAATSTQASALAGDAWAALDAAQYSTVAGVWFGAVDLGVPVPYPDEESGMSRYQFVASIRVGHIL